LKIKMNQMEKGHALHIQDMSHQNELQKRAEMDNLTKHWSGKMQDDRVMYETQIKNCKQKINDYENRLANSAADLERLNHQLEDKSSEADAWRTRHVNLEKAKTIELDEQAIHHEHEKKAALGRELGDQGLKHAVEKAQLELKIKDFKQKNIDLENRTGYLAMEVERLNRQLEEMTKDMDMLRGRYAQLEQEKDNEIDDLLDQCDDMKKQCLINEDQQIRFEAERSALETQIMQLRQKLAEHEGTIADLSKETQKYHGLYNDKLYEAEELRSRLNSFDGEHTSEIHDLIKEVDLYKRLAQEAKDLRMKFDVEKNSYENQNAQLRQFIESNKVEASKLHDIIGMKKSDNELLQRQVADGKQEVNRILKDFKNLELDLYSKANTIDQLHKEQEEMAKSKDMFKNQLDRNTAEVTRKNKELMDKIQDLDILKRKYEDALNGDPTSLGNSKVMNRHQSHTSFSAEKRH